MKMLNEEMQEFFSGGLLTSVYPNFPYPQRFCRFCERELEVTNAIHLNSEPSVYKVLYVCHNKDCGAYDFEARMQYTRVYYPSETARQLLEDKSIRYNPTRKS